MLGRAVGKVFFPLASFPKASYLWRNTKGGVVLSFLQPVSEDKVPIQHGEMQNWDF